MGLYGVICMGLYELYRNVCVIWVRDYTGYIGMYALYG